MSFTENWVIIVNLILQLLKKWEKFKSLLFICQFDAMKIFHILSSYRPFQAERTRRFIRRKSKSLLQCPGGLSHITTNLSNPLMALTFLLLLSKKHFYTAHIIALMSFIFCNSHMFPQTDLICVIFSPRMYFWAQFFSTWKQNCCKNLATKQRK